MIALRRPCAIAIALTAAAVGLLGQQAAPQFRTTVAGVPVPVSVQFGRQPARGLTIGDFQLLDNGVPQQIVAVDDGRTPLDVTIITVPIESRSAVRYRLREAEGEASRGSRRS